MLVAVRVDDPPDYSKKSVQDALVVRAREGDSTAWDELLSALSGFFARYVQRFSRHASVTLSDEDLLQECACAAVLALESYDVNRAAKFSSYLHYPLVQALTKAVASQSFQVAVPSNINSDLLAFHGAEGDGNWLEWSADRFHNIERVATLTQRGYSLDQLLHADDSESGDTFGDRIIADGDVSVMAAELPVKVLARLSQLDSIDAAIISGRLGLLSGVPETRASLGGRFGVTGQAIANAEPRAFVKLLHLQPSLCVTAEHVERAFGSSETPAAALQ